MTPFFESPERQATLLAEAASWLGTPFRARAAVKGAAVDCVCLTAEVMLACGLIDGYEFPRYSLDWAKHHDRSLVLEWLATCPQVERLPEGEPEELYAAARIGDVLGFKVGRCVQHVGIKLDGREFLNSIEGARVARCRLEKAAQLHLSPGPPLTMSSQAGSSNLASDLPKTGGLNSTNISTNQQGVIVRYFAGVAKYAVTWLGPAYNQTAKPVKSANGGKASSSASSSHKYYADCAALLNVGLTDAVREVWMQNEKVWVGNVTRAAGDDFARISIENHCAEVTIYWGTETQPVDPLLAPHDHPAYRGQCYVVFKQLYFGQDTTSAPNIEFVMQRAAHDSPLAAESTLDGDVIPQHAMIELLTNQRFGLGWSAADALDLVAWQAAAAQCFAEGVAISPLLEREQDARAMLAQFCDYFDGYLTAEPQSQGKLALKLARPFSGDANTLPLLGEYELLDVPDPVSQHWRETFNQFTVKYTDQSSDFQDNSVIHNDPSNRRAVGGPLPTSLERPWVTKTALAVQMGVYAARLQSVPWVTAKEIHVRKEAAAGIEPGSFVRLTYADYLETIIMRVTSRKVESDRSQQVSFELRADGYYSDILTYTPDLPPKPDVPLIEPAAPIYQRIVELPAGLVPVRHDQNRPQLAALVARGSALDVRFRVYSSDDNTEYDENTHSRLFCVYGTLAADVPLTCTLDDSDDGLLIDFPGVDNGLDLETTREPGRLKSRLLVFVGDEILAYRDVEIVGPTRARLVGLRRGCYDTLMAPHETGAAVAIIRRRDLSLWTDSTYDKGEDVHVKVATATAQATRDLAEVDDVVVTIQSRSTRPLPPLNLRINGQGGAPTYSGGDVLIEWDTASWRRHGFWESWDEAYIDPTLFHKVKVVAADGTVKRKFNALPGTSSVTYAAADVLEDFGGSVPATWKVQVLARRRGAKSLFPLEQVVTAAATAATNPPPRTNWMVPSRMSQVLGACDPETMVDRNFALVAARFGLSLPATAAQDEDTAANAVQGNFTTVAAALNLSLFPVATSRDPEVATQANFERINAFWADDAQRPHVPDAASRYALTGIQPGFRCIQDDDGQTYQYRAPSTAVAGYFFTDGTLDAIYVPAGIANGRPFYHRLGTTAGANEPFSLTWSAIDPDEGTLSWNFFSETGALIAFSFEDVPTPDLAGEWSNERGRPHDILCAPVLERDLVAGLTITNDPQGENGIWLVGAPEPYSLSGRNTYRGPQVMTWNGSVWGSGTGDYTDDNLPFPWLGVDSHSFHGGYTMERNDVAAPQNWAVIA